jgi:Ni/Co efflux regulator RcnB
MKGITMKRHALKTTLFCAVLTLGGIVHAHHAAAQDHGDWDDQGDRHYIQRDDDRWNHDDDRWRHYREEHDARDRHERRERVVFRDDDRVVIHDYMDEHYHHHCPPGLYKKHDYCVAPGHVRYIVGQPLPPEIVYQPAPVELVEQLQPVPRGYQYVQVDGDVLLMNQASKDIIDAVTLLSAVNRH